ncbi:Peptide-N(4)-(N-acetyl-beta-glucosaminyl)asparagine amidase [Candida viswanathii]|uniref:Peptide:N-glycanase 1 n=1 Tax=Candida viswanathii TaxID=5486 RepID=A0A367YL76_9ASCO|nr:Peptide-N(4)-(N-acetyl-beta-glucosaminyl)asparagine amidase [Candida viswanathii]
MPPIDPPIDYKKLADKLITAYAKRKIEYDSKTSLIPQQELRHDSQLPVIGSILSLANCTDKYRDPIALDAVLDSIDLEKIYGNLEKREQENTDPELDYDDLLVRELLHYFKNDFFTWVNKPKCPCGSEDVDSKGARRGAPGNPDQVSVIEVYQCKSCGQRVEFPRINNPVSLLKSRKGRCGEWVNCFMLILHALIGGGGDTDRIRYVWNQEDHVWCEYYSFGAKRWIHLDPCEAVADEPLLYCNNWGKKMSFVIGFNRHYMIDLSDKYITPEKQIDKATITSEKKVKAVIRYLNSRKQSDYYRQVLLQSTPEDALIQVYQSIIVPRNAETLKKTTSISPETTATNDLPVGRQSGSAEWTKSRGESG